MMKKVAEIVAEKSVKMKNYTGRLKDRRILVCQMKLRR